VGLRSSFRVRLLRLTTAWSGRRCFAVMVPRSGHRDAWGLGSGRRRAKPELALASANLARRPANCPPVVLSIGAGLSLMVGHVAPGRSLDLSMRLTSSLPETAPTTSTLISSGPRSMTPRALAARGAGADQRSAMLRGPVVKLGNRLPERSSAPTCPNGC